MSEAVAVAAEFYYFYDTTHDNYMIIKHLNARPKEEEFLA